MSVTKYCNVHIWSMTSVGIPHLIVYILLQAGVHYLVVSLHWKQMCQQVVFFVSGGIFHHDWCRPSSLNDVIDNRLTPRDFF